MSAPMLGPVELVMLLLFSGGGLGMPIGIPPEKEDPLLARVAPADCFFYMSWAGTAAPNVASTNHTEQLLAEPQVRKFLEDAQRSLVASMQQGMIGGAPNGAARADVITKLLKTMTSRGGAVFVSDFKLQPGGPPDIQGGLLVNVGDDVDEIRATLEKLQTENATTEVQTVEIGKSKYYRFQPDPTAPVITWGTRGKYLIAGFGKDSVEGILQRASGQAPAWLTELRRRLAIPRVSAVSYINLQKILRLVETQSGEPRAAEIIRVLGFDKLVALSSVSGLDETGFVNRLLLNTESPATGILSLLDSKPLAAADLGAIPQNAPAALTFKLDPAQVLNTWLAIVNQIDPQAAAQMTQGINQFEQPLGINLRDDFLKPLGDTWRIHADPNAGGLLFGWILSVPLRDRQRFGQTHDRLLQMAGPQLNGTQPGVPVLKTTDSAGHKVHTLTLPQPGIPIAPSWCVTDRELLIGATAAAIPAMLGRKPGAPSIADQPAVAKLFQGQPAPLAMLYLDMSQIAQTVYPFLQGALQQATQMRQAAGGGPAALPNLPPIDVVAKHLQPSVMVVERTPDGIEFVSRQTLPGGNLGTTAPVSIALLLPAVQAAREAAGRASGSNNLKQILLAMHNHHDTFGALPAAHNADKEDKPLLSWRVHILPFIEQAPLYERFHLDEPWDSEHNKKLIPLIPKTYQAPGSTVEIGKTNYLGISGADYVFVVPKAGDTPKTRVKGSRFQDVLDGTSNTIGVVEANDDAAVIWTKPGDFEPNEKDLLKGLVGLRPGGFQAAMMDGSVRFIAQTIDKGLLKALFTKNGGERIPRF